MITVKPTLAVNNLVVLKNQKEVLNITFHGGVNIISGHNSSGKTTVLDFLAFALGAENIPWKQEALLCDEVVAEVRLNHRAITLRRSVTEKPLSPTHVFWGDISAA